MAEAVFLIACGLLPLLMGWERPDNTANLHPDPTVRPAWDVPTVPPAWLMENTEHEVQVQRLRG